MRFQGLWKLKWNLHSTATTVYFLRLFFVWLQLNLEEIAKIIYPWNAPSYFVTQERCTNCKYLFSVLLGVCVWVRLMGRSSYKMETNKLYWKVSHQFFHNSYKGIYVIIQFLWCFSGLELTENLCVFFLSQKNKNNKETPIIFVLGVDLFTSKHEFRDMFCLYKV